MKFSIICFVITLVLGFISMGLWGQLLYYIVSPILNIKFPPMSAWTGDWVWPALIYAGILWSFGFLISGWAHLYLVKLGWSKVVLYGIYIGILLLWDLLLWILILT